MARLMLIGGMGGDELEEYLVARHKLYGHVSLTWSAQPEMVQETIKKLGLAEALPASQVKQIARGKAKYIFPPYVSAAGPADEYKRFLAGELECGFERPQYFTTLAAATSGEVIASPTEKPRSAPAGKASNMRPLGRQRGHAGGVGLVGVLGGHGCLPGSWREAGRACEDRLEGREHQAIRAWWSCVALCERIARRHAEDRFGPVVLLKLPELQRLAGKTVSASSTYGVDYVYAGMKSKDGRLFVATVNNIMKKYGRAALSCREGGSLKALDLTTNGPDEEAIEEVMFHRDPHGYRQLLHCEARRRHRGVFGGDSGAHVSVGCGSHRASPLCGGPASRGTRARTSIWILKIMPHSSPLLRIPVPIGERPALINGEGNTRICWG